MKIVPLSHEERLAIDARADAWAGPLTPEQFLGRNRRLYDHPYGREAMQTYGLRDDAGRIVSSLERLEISLLLRDEKEVILEETAGLIASVVTPAAERGKGLATRLLKGFFDARSREPFVLYSDIGPRFYERFGFEAFPTSSLEVPSAPGASESAFPLSLDAFTLALRRARRETVEKAKGEIAVLYPQTRFLDWQLERFRYFAELAGKAFPPTVSWKLSHADPAHLVSVFPDFLTGKANVFWAPECETCLAFARDVAHRWGLPTVRYWSRHAGAEGSKPEYPMIRVPGMRPAFLDLQFCDWW